MPLQFLDASHQPRQHPDRDGVDLAVFAVRDAGLAFVVVRVSRRPHEDRLVSRLRLGQGRDRVPEVRAQVRFAVTVDDAVVAEAQVQDVQCFSRVAPGEHLAEDVGEPAVAPGERLERDRVVDVVGLAERDRPHREVRTPGDPVGSAGISGLAARRDARHRGTVGELLPGLGGGAEQEPLVDRLALEDRVFVVDPAVDHPDGHPGARRCVGPLEQAYVAVGAVGANGVEPPLVVEIEVPAVLLAKLLRGSEEFRRGQALPGVGGDAGGGRRRGDRRERRGPGSRSRGAPAERGQDDEIVEGYPDHRPGRYRIGAPYGTASPPVPPGPPRGHRGPCS